MSRVYKLTDWLLDILSLQFQWIIHIFKGFIIAGIFPSTAAVFAVVRHWILKRELQLIGDLFRKYYHENFKSANILGWMFSIISCIIVMNFLYVPYYPVAVRIAMYGIILFMALFLVFGWIYLFPTIVHFNMSVNQLFAMILKLGFSSFSGVIMQVFIVGIFLMIIYIAPAFLVLFGVTPLALVQMSISMNVFEKVNS